MKLSLQDPVCWCDAYPFPHRFGSGKCTDTTALASLFDVKKCGEHKCLIPCGADEDGFPEFECSEMLYGKKLKHCPRHEEIVTVRLE